MSHPETILVTGATGTVGGALVPLLAAAGARVRAASRNEPPGGATRPRVEAARLDLRDPNATDAALRGVDRVFLATPLEEDMATVAGRVVDQARRAGVRQIVRLSAYGAGGRADTRLAEIHGETEEALARSGVAWIALRPNAFMQNVVAQFGASIRGSGRFNAPQGDGRVSTVDARDVAAVAARLLRGSPTTSGCYELTGPAALSNLDIARILTGVLGREIAYVDEAPERTRDTLLSFGLSTWLVEIVMDLYDLSARGGAAHVSPDIARLLDREPTPFAAFAAEHADAFR